MWLQEPHISVLYQTQPLSNLSPPDAQRGASPKSQSHQWQRIFYCSVHRKHGAFTQSQYCDISKVWIFDDFLIFGQNWAFTVSHFVDSTYLFVLKCCCVTEPGSQVWARVTVCADFLCRCSPCVCMNFLWVFWFLPSFHEHTGRWLAYTKLPPSCPDMYKNVCVHGAPFVYTYSWQMLLFKAIYNWAIIFFYI